MRGCMDQKPVNYSSARHPGMQARPPAAQPAGMQTKPPATSSATVTTAPPSASIKNGNSAAPYYKKVIESIDQLPSFPAIVTKLIKVVNSPDSSAEDAAKLIEKDPGLTSKMIRLANSAFYGIPRSISSVSSAVVILGFNTIRSLVLSASVMKMFSGTQKSAIDKERFWMHSITTAMAAKIIVRHYINIRMMDPESAFCSGILHDIGKLIFNEYMGNEYLEAYKFAQQNNISLYDAETRVLGVNHAEIGKIISDKWALPLDLEYSLVYHHDPGSADQLNDLIAIIHFADTLAHDVGASFWENEPVPISKSSFRTILRVSDSDYQKIKESLVENLEKSDEFFSIIR